jgi:drug/metabolite transporter (DMT)-like permease
MSDGVLLIKNMAVPRVRPGGRRVAVLALGLCCVFWGYSFPAMQKLSAAWDRAVPAALAGDAAMRLGLRATFLGWRFALAALLYWVLTHPRQRGYRPADWTGGLVVGALMSPGMFLQLVGLRYTLPSVSAFITALAVVFAPLGQGLVLRERVSGRIWLAVALALAGTLLLSQGSAQAADGGVLASRPPLPYLGEALTLLGTVVFTCQIMAVDRLAPRADAARLTFIMLMTVATVNTIGGVVIAGHAIYQLNVLKALVLNHTLWWVMPTLVLFSTVIALHLMNIYQPRIAPAAACVVYCLEPVFGTAFSVGMGTEGLARMTVAGGAVVLAAVLVVARADVRERAQKDSGLGEGVPDHCWRGE